MLELYGILSNPIALGIYIALAIGGSIYISISRQLKRQKELQLMADSLGIFI
jgi:preprotein translocase subunit YajC